MDKLQDGRPVADGQRAGIAMATIQRGVELASQRRLAEAEAVFRQAVQEDENYPPAHHNLGVALAEQGKLEAARESLLRAVGLDPNYAEAHTNLGNVQRARGEVPAAMASYRRAIQIRPDSAEAFSNLGLTLAENKQPAEAAVLLRQAVRLKPDYADGWNNLGLALEKLGRFEEAEAARRTAMPRVIKPMLAKLAQMPGQPDLYGFEYKWDGERVIAFWDGRGSRLRLQSRNLLDVTGQYPELQTLGEALGRTAAILDGEIVAIDQGGRISFHLLQRRMHLLREQDGRRAMAQTPVCYMLFDLLHWRRRSLMDQPYTARRARLAELGLKGPSWQTTAYFPGEGAVLLKSARVSHMEGVLAKRLDSPYQPGLRTGAWLKIKFAIRQEFVIGGWTPIRKAGEPASIGALLVGCYDGGKLIYAGSVGTGFSEQGRRELHQMLARIKRASSPFDGPPPRRDAIYVSPTLVAEVESREWTPAGILRQPAFKGLRSDKPAREVVREEVKGG